MRSSSQSVSPSARWSDCSATSVKSPSYRGGPDGTASLGSPPVAPRYLVMLLALGAIWGASYLFNEIALDELEPAPLIEGRFLLGLMFLVPAVLVVGEPRTTGAALRAAPWRLAVVALLNAA